jgi:hypothetical protein
MDQARQDAIDKWTTAYSYLERMQYNTYGCLWEKYAYEAQGSLLDEAEMAAEFHDPAPDLGCPSGNNNPFLQRKSVLDDSPCYLSSN